MIEFFVEINSYNKIKVITDKLCCSREETKSVKNNVDYCYIINVFYHYIIMSENFYFARV